jgi:hypothetical protein
MMPQLGVLAEVHPKGATEVFNKDCLIHLGHASRRSAKPGRQGSSDDYTIEFPMAESKGNVGIR